METKLSFYASCFSSLRQKIESTSVQDALNNAIEKQYQANKWFTPTFSHYAINSIVSMLEDTNLEILVNRYAHQDDLLFNRDLNIAVISAGNIPLAAFHDFFSVLISGNRFYGKLSSQDNILLPFLAELLISIEPSFSEKIFFVDKINDYDAIIATGSNNTNRYFEYYFGKKPHFFRKNRNSIAVLTGTEDGNQLQQLCNDMLLYFGLGCRSVSKLLVPQNYNFAPLIAAIDENSSSIANHHLYLNNLEYQKTIYLMKNLPFIDAGSLILAENEQLSSPISIVYYQYYSHFNQVDSYLKQQADNLQCIVAESINSLPTISFGHAQTPSLLDFPDSFDTIRFLGTLPL